jgi:hypothetical protein
MVSIQGRGRPLKHELEPHPVALRALEVISIELHPRERTRVPIAAGIANRPILLRHGSSPSRTSGKRQRGARPSRPSKHQPFSSTSLAQRGQGPGRWRNRRSRRHVRSAAGALVALLDRVDPLALFWLLIARHQTIASRSFAPFHCLGSPRTHTPLGRGGRDLVSV